MITIAAGVCLGLLAFCLILAYARLILWLALAGTAVIVLGLLAWTLWEWRVSDGQDHHLIQAAVQGGALAFFSAIGARFKAKRPDIMRALRRQERLGQPLDPSSAILLIREDDRLIAETRHDPFPGYPSNITARPPLIRSTIGLLIFDRATIQLFRNRAAAVALLSQRKRGSPAGQCLLVNHPKRCDLRFCGFAIDRDSR